MQAKGKKDATINKKPLPLKEPETGVCTRSKSKEVHKSVELPEETFPSSYDKSANSSSFDDISVSSLLSDTDIGKINSDGLPSSDFTVSSINTIPDDFES